MKIAGKYFLIYLALFYQWPAAYCQQNTIDSLNFIFKTSKYDSVKFNVLVELSEICEINDILKYAEPALTLADKMQLDKLNAHFISNAKKYRASAFSNLGLYYNSQGNIEMALNYLDKGLKIREEVNDKLGAASSLNSIGTIYQSQGDYPAALDNFTRSLNMQERIGDKNGMAFSLNNIGQIYQHNNKLSLALDYYGKSLKLFEEVNDKLGIANMLNNIGAIYGIQGNLGVALDFYLKSLNIRTKLHDKQGMAYSLDNVGRIYFKLGELSIALSYADSSLTISKRYGFSLNIQNAEHLLSKIDSARGNYAGALEHFKQRIIFRDSINNESTRKASIRSQLKYEYDKKEAVIREQQEKEKVLAEEKNHRQQIIIWSVAAGLLLVIGFAGFVFRSLKVTREQKIIIEEKQKDILDSIRYAKRIQHSLLPNEKHIDKSLKRLMKN